MPDKPSSIPSDCEGTLHPTMPNAALFDRLCCPLHAANLRYVESRLVCDAGHEIPVEDGVPVFAEKPRIEPRPLNMPPLAPRAAPRRVDEFVDDWVVNTNGNLYWHARGRLSRYPIPRWPAPNASSPGQVLVDLGCSWGRWTIAAARAGFMPCGVDVHLDALQAANAWPARRASPPIFSAATRPACHSSREAWISYFSYSVLQHLDKRRVRHVLSGIAAALRPGGACLVQMPNAFGLVSLLRQMGRGFREPAPDTLAMRYWTARAIIRAFRQAGFASVRIRAEGFFVQNTQREDLDLLSRAGAAAVLSSCALTAVSNAVPPLAGIADSLWIEARK